MKLRSMALLGALAVLIVVLKAAPALAFTVITPPIFTITCSGLTQTSGGANLMPDRDTDGAGNEQIDFEVTDGDGTVIFSFHALDVVGVPVILTPFSYTTTPDYNPIRFVLTSPAGNGFAHQPILDMTGSCAGLPTFVPPTPIVSSVPAISLPIFVWDDRVNRSQTIDEGQPVAIFERNNSIIIYAINPENSQGSVVLEISAVDIGNVPAENTLIDSAVNPFTGAAIAVWHLASGEFQLNTAYADGKPYVRTWIYGDGEVSYEP